MKKGKRRMSTEVTSMISLFTCGGSKNLRRKCITNILIAVLTVSAMPFPAVNIQAQELSPEGVETDIKEESINVESEIQGEEINAEEEGSAEESATVSSNEAGKMEEPTEPMKLADSSDDIAGGTYNENGADIEWNIDKDGKLTAEGTGQFEIREGGLLGVFVDYPWKDYRQDIKSAEIKLSGLTSTVEMFASCSNLTSIDMSNFNTSNVTDMRCMFINCSNLTSIDVSNFDTSNVINMEGMFHGCSKLTSIDVSNFDTSNVTDMGCMFYGCSNLTDIDLSNFNTSNVTSMRWMFGYCNNLTSIDLSSFDTSNVINMESMFYCFEHSNLTSIDVSNFDTGNVIKMCWMFYGCSNLTSIDVNNFDTSNVINMDWMFARCSNLTSIDVSNFNTSNVTNMERIFFECSNLASIDVSNFDTSNVINMQGMFECCSNLTSIDVSNFDTSNVTIMDRMFECCSNLTNIDLSNFNTSSVNSMNYMFYNCNNLNSINISNFDTSNVIFMADMFEGCSNLTNIDLSNFDTSNVFNMRWMFSGCDRLSVIDTPLNVPQSVDLPYDTDEKNVWSDIDGKIYTELPQNLSYSIRLTRGRKPDSPTEPGNPATPDTPTQPEEPPHSSDGRAYIKNYPAGGYFYTGKARKPEVVVLDGSGAELKLKTDYTVAYKKNTNAGEATITIKGKGKKKEDVGIKTIKFTIQPAGMNMTAFGMSDIKAKTYTTKEQHPSVKVWMTLENGKKKTLKAKKDYTLDYKAGNNTDAGQGVVVIKATSGNYTGELTKEYTINARPLKKGVKFKKIPAQGYTGSEIRPEVALKYGKTMLKEGTDYTVSYRNNTERGKAEIIINGQGNYTGELTKTFTIK